METEETTVANEFEELETKRKLETKRDQQKKERAEEKIQAERFRDNLINLLKEVRDGTRKCDPDQGNMPLSIPGSTVPIVKMMPPEISGEREEASLELKTSKPHDFKKGQRVVITGVRCVTEDAPEVAPEVDGVQKLAASLNATHVVDPTDDCRFSFPCKLQCRFEDAQKYLDFTKAEAALSVENWLRGEKSLFLELLLKSRETASNMGLGLVLTGLYELCCTPLRKFRSMAGSTARDMQATQESEEIVPLTGSFQVAILNGIHGLQGVDVPELSRYFWGRSIELCQPESWESSVGATLCLVCIRPFGQKDGCADKGKHHCRNCGGVVCDACSKAKMPLPWKGQSEARVCDICKDLVQVKNDVIEDYERLEKQIRAVQSGDYTPPRPKAKAKATAKAKGPPRILLAKSKEKCKEKEAKEKEAKEKDLSRRSHSSKVEDSTGAAKVEAKRPPPSNEDLMLKVAMIGCKNDFEEIKRSLEHLSLEGVVNVEMEIWLSALKQIMVLFEKPSATLQRIKDTPEDELKEWHEIQLRQHFLHMDCLSLRFKILSLQYELREVKQKELFWDPIGAAGQAIQTMLVTSSSQLLPQLLPEVNDVLKELMKLKPQTFIQTIPELAESEAVRTSDPKLFGGVWEAGNQGTCNVQAFLDKLQPVLPAPNARGLELAIRDYRGLLEEWTEIQQKVQHAKSTELSLVVERQKGVLDKVFKGLQETLESVGVLLDAFGMKKDSKANPKAFDDLLSKHLRTMVNGLKEHEPTVLTEVGHIARTVERPAQRDASEKSKKTRKRRELRPTFVKDKAPSVATADESSDTHEALSEAAPDAGNESSDTQVEGELGTEIAEI